MIIIITTIIDTTTKLLGITTQAIENTGLTV